MYKYQYKSYHSSTDQAHHIDIGSSAQPNYNTLTPSVSSLSPVGMGTETITNKCTDIFIPKRYRYKLHNRFRRRPTIPSESQKLPQSGRPQFHLANERTYLAWQRTGFTSVALGIAVVKFGGIRDYTTNNANSASSQSILSGQPTTRSIISGCLLVGLGCVTIIYGTIRFERINRQLADGYFVVGSRGIEPVICSILTIIVVFISMILLFTRID